MIAAELIFNNIETNEKPTMKTLKKLSDLHPRGKISSWSDVNPSLGNKFYSLDGIPIARGDKIGSLPRLPAVLNNARMVAGDLIPSSSWGSSLANLLTKKSWDMLRHPLIEKNNGICEMCGQKFPVLDVHEDWSYWFFDEGESSVNSPAMPGKTGIQQLNGLLTLCKDCHKCFHLGKANADGEIDQVLGRLALLNGWGKAETTQYFRTVSRRWEALSKFSWVLELGAISHPEGFLTIKSPWTRVDSDQRFLTAPGRFGPPSLTAITSHPWRFVKDSETTLTNAQDLIV